MRGATVLKVLLGIIGAVVSVVLIATAFFHIDLSGTGQMFTPRFKFFEFLSSIPSHLVWLLPFCLLSALIIPARALQWQATLPMKVPFKERYHLVAIGAFVHNVIPGKFGDIFRAFLMGRTQKIPVVQSLGSVAVCKLMEFAALMLLVTLSFLGPFADTMKNFSGGLRIAIGTCVALFAVVVLMARYATTLAHKLERKNRFHKVQRFLHNIGEGFGAARSAKLLGLTLLLSIPPVLFPALGYGFALQTMGIPGGVFAGAVVLGAIALGQATPGIPAGTGIYYFVTSWAARSLGASGEEAAAFAALTHLGTIVTMISVGAVSVWIRKIRWRDLKARAKGAAEEVKHAQEEEESHSHAVRV